jgi:hypothetical protein
VAPVASTAGALRSRLASVGWGLCATIVHPSRGLSERGSGSKLAQADLSGRARSEAFEEFLALGTLKDVKSLLQASASPRKAWHGSRVTGIDETAGYAETGKHPAQVGRAK